MTRGQCACTGGVCVCTVYSGTSLCICVLHIVFVYVFMCVYDWMTHCEPNLFAAGEIN